MNFVRSLLKSYGLILVFLLISLSSGFSLTLQLQEKALPDICILKSLEQLNISGNLNHEKIVKEKEKSEFRKKRQPNKNTQKNIKSNFSNSTEQEDNKESSVKSYNQLKGLLEEVEMMVGGWI